MQPWSSEEIYYLEEIAGTDEISKIVKRFRLRGRRNGWPERTEQAVLVKMKKLKISFRPTEAGWNCTTLAEILDVSRDRVHDWVARKLLRSDRAKGKRHHRITAKNFICFARNHPEWLTDINQNNLCYILPQPLVNRVLAQTIRTQGIKQPVRTNEGIAYPSLRAAAEGEYFSKAHIRKIAKSGRSTRNGISFARKEAT